MRAKERTYIFLLMLMVAVYEGCLCWQGFSMLDEGWVMSAYQWIFKDPASVQYQMLYYNGLIVGGVWEKLFGQWGYLGFRICDILFVEYIAVMVYLLLKPYADRWCVMAGLFLAFLMCDAGTLVIHHNCITAATVVTAVYFLQKALCNTSYKCMLTAGIILGVNVFTRLPNLSFCALILVLIPYYLFTRSVKQTLCLLGAGVGGFLVGMGLEVIFMMAMGHWQYFVENLTSGLSASGATDSTHRLGAMMPRYIDQYLFICKHIAVFCIFPLVLWICNYKAWKGTYVNIAQWLALAATVGVIVLKFTPAIIDVYAFLTIILVFNIYQSCKHPGLQRGEHHGFVYLVALSLLVAYLQPLGSDWGVMNMGEQSVYMAMPLAVYLLYTNIIRLQNRIMMSAYVGLILCVYLCVSTYSIITHCDFDFGPRWEKTYRINHPLATTYTQKSYADAVNELLPVLARYVKDGDYMFNYPGFPTVHYLTHTRSYTGNTWSWSYDSGNLDRQLRKAEREKGLLPVMLVGKGETLGDFSKYDPDWDNTHAEETYFHHNNTIRVVQNFIKRNDYRVAWENNVFQILVPEKKN